MFCWRNKIEKTSLPSTEVNIDKLTQIFATAQKTSAPPYATVITPYLTGRDVLKLSEVSTFFNGHKSLNLKRLQGRNESLQNEIKNIQAELKPIHEDILQAIHRMPNVHAKVRFSDVYDGMNKTVKLHKEAILMVCKDVGCITLPVVCISTTSASIAFIILKKLSMLPILLPFATSSLNLTCASACTPEMMPALPRHTALFHCFNEVISLKGKLFAAFREFGSVIKIYQITKHPAELEKELKHIELKIKGITEDIEKIAVHVNSVAKSETEDEEEEKNHDQQDNKENELIGPVTSQLGL